MFQEDIGVLFLKFPFKVDPCNTGKLSYKHEAVSVLPQQQGMELYGTPQFHACFPAWFDQKPLENPTKPMEK